jgi:hypothetical protein
MKAYLIDAATMLHADGTAERHVTGRYGELIGRMPRPTGGE